MEEKNTNKTTGDNVVMTIDVSKAEQGPLHHIGILIGKEDMSVDLNERDYQTVVKHAAYLEMDLANFVAFQIKEGLYALPNVPRNRP